MNFYNGDRVQQGIGQGVGPEKDPGECFVALWHQDGDDEGYGADGGAFNETAGDGGYERGNNTATVSRARLKGKQARERYKYLAGS